MASDILNQALALFQQGFDTVNSIQGLGIRFLGYIIAITVLYIVRRMLMNR